jgi:hypothetical protein
MASPPFGFFARGSSFSESPPLMLAASGRARGTCAERPLPNTAWSLLRQMPLPRSDLG